MVKRLIVNHITLKSARPKTILKQEGKQRLREVKEERGNVENVS